MFYVVLKPLNLPLSAPLVQPGHTADNDPPESSEALITILD